MKQFEYRHTNGKPVVRACWPNSSNGRKTKENGRLHSTYVICFAFRMFCVENRRWIFEAILYEFTLDDVESRTCAMNDKRFTSDTDELERANGEYRRRRAEIVHIEAALLFPIRPFRFNRTSFTSCSFCVAPFQRNRIWLGTASVNWHARRFRLRANRKEEKKLATRAQRMLCPFLSNWIFVIVTFKTMIETQFLISAIGILPLFSRPSCST